MCVCVCVCACVRACIIEIQIPHEAKNQRAIAKRTSQNDKIWARCNNSHTQLWHRLQKPECLLWSVPEILSIRYLLYLSQLTHAHIT